MNIMHAAIIRPEGHIAALSTLVGAVSHILPDIAVLFPIAYYCMSMYFMVTDRRKLHVVQNEKAFPTPTSQVEYKKVGTVSRIINFLRQR